MSKPVCLVTGVGPEGGTGAETARRFSEAGYRVAMLARNADNLAALAGKYGDCRAYGCDVADLDALVETVSRVKAEMDARRAGRTTSSPSPRRSRRKSTALPTRTAPPGPSGSSCAPSARPGRAAAYPAVRKPS